MPNTCCAASKLQHLVMLLHRLNHGLMLCFHCRAAPTGVLGLAHTVKGAGRDAVTTHIADVLKLVADQSGESHCVGVSQRCHYVCHLGRPGSLQADKLLHWLISVNLPQSQHATGSEECVFLADEILASRIRVCCCPLSP